MKSLGMLPATDEQVRVFLRITPTQLRCLKQILQNNSMINSEWEILNWDKRQMKSDHSNERVAKFRSKSKDDEKRYGNVTVTGCNGVTVTGRTEPEPEPEQNISCAEPKNFDSTPAIYELPCAGKKSYPVTGKQVEEWSVLFPGVDVHRELRKMVAWLAASPDRRKTFRGAPRFVVNWLGREQDKAPSSRVNGLHADSPKPVQPGDPGCLLCGGRGLYDDGRGIDVTCDCVLRRLQGGKR
jgi:hypothetical protein